VVQALRQVGVADTKTFLLGRRLFRYMAAVDFRRHLTLHPRFQEWGDLMGSFQEKVPEARENEKWALMGKMFQL
jgi:L-rhamnose mutarotase